MAAGLLRHHLAARGTQARVSSSGLSFDGRPAAPEAVEAMLQMGIDLAGHTSRMLDADQLAAADLVLAMERQHVREVYLLDGAAIDRAFTLPEFVRRAVRVGPRTTPLEAWVRQVSAGRRPAELVGESSDDEIPDPYGGPPAVFERTAQHIDELCSRAADLLCGLLPPPLAADKVGAGLPASDEQGRPRPRLWRR